MGGILTLPDKRMAERAYEQVLDMILSGQLKPGTLIQERRLANHLQMSRTPLRDAFMTLEGEGLLVRNEARGLQVRSMNIEDFVENLAVRSLLESEAARVAAGKIAAASLAKLRSRLETLLERAEAKTGAPDREDVRSVDDELHSAISDAAGNRQMASIIKMLRMQTRMFDLRSVPERLEDTCREHIAIVSALAEGRGDDAADAMRSHLNCVRQSIILRLASI